MLASLYLLGVLIPHTVGAQTPAIYLFPTNVVENIKQTGRVARDMESTLQTSVADLEQQWLLYEENRCEDAAGDPGCDQITMLLGDTYLRMLLLMDASLPRMQASVQTTVDSIEKQLRTELGIRMSASDLQQLLSGPRVNGRRPGPHGYRQPMGRLSERFHQYYRLVSQPRASTQDSMSVVAAEIYLDGKEVLELIALTENEITQSRLMIEMRNEFATLTPDMNDVLADVKRILFGEADMVR